LQKKLFVKEYLFRTGTMSGTNLEVISV